MRPSKDEYLMQVAQVVSTRATCTRRQVGAVIADASGHILATGYNGSAPGAPHCTDVGCLMVDGHCRRTVHAEQNAVAHAARTGVSLNGAIAYLTVRPCPTCLLLLASAGVKVVYYDEDYHKTDDDVTDRLAYDADVKLSRLNAAAMPVPGSKIGEIIRLTGLRFDLRPADILGSGQSRALSRARQVVMYLARKLTPLSFGEIGRALNRDHSTVAHGVSVITDLMKSDPEFGFTVRVIEAELTGADAGERPEPEPEPPPKKMTRPLSSLERQCLTVILANGPLSSHEIADKVGITRITVFPILNALARDGLIIGEDRTDHRVWSMK